MNAPQKEIHPFEDAIHSFCIFADMKRIMTYILLIAVMTGCSAGRTAKIEKTIAEGDSLFAAKRYTEAMIEYSEAERLASANDDHFALGKIYRAMAHISNATYGYADEIGYLRLASDEFGKAGKPYNSTHVEFEKGLAYYNSQDYASAEKVYRDVLYKAHESADTLLEAQCLSAYAALSLEVNRPDPSLAIDMLSRVANELKCPLTSADRGMLAYAYSLAGMHEEADEWVRKALQTAATPAETAQARFREYQIRSRSGADAAALDALEEVMDYSNSVEMTSLRKSVVTSRQDYLDKQHELTRSRLSTARLMTAFIILIFLAVTFALTGYLRYRKLESEKLLAEEKSETEKYMTIAEELQTKLRSATKRLPSEKHTAIAKYDLLERLCEQYYIYEGTDNLQGRILKEVKSVIDGLRVDPKALKGLELMLDRNRNNIVARLREQMPKLKPDDVKLFIFAASGFSSTTISTILEKEKGVVYNRIWRLKGKISSSEAPDKDDFLDAVNA